MWVANLSNLSNLSNLGIRMAIQRGAEVDGADATFHAWTALHFAADRSCLSLSVSVSVSASVAVAVAVLHLAAHLCKPYTLQLDPAPQTLDPQPTP